MLKTANYGTVRIRRTLDRSASDEAVLGTCHRDATATVTFLIKSQIFRCMRGERAIYKNHSFLLCRIFVTVSFVPYFYKVQRELCVPRGECD